jgi:6-phosphogluconolactonase
MTTMLTTRRQFLAAGAVLPFALRTMAQGPAAARWVFLGTDHGNGIYRAPWNAATGELGAIELAVETERPNFFALHPKLPVLYTVNSVGGGNGGVSSFRVDKSLGSLKLINRVSSHGDGPCAMSVDKDGKNAYIANYTGGSVAAYALDAEGKPRNSSNFSSRGNAACGTPGPVKDRQDTPHMHCVSITPGQKNMVVCNLGEDTLDIFRLDNASGPFAEVVYVPARCGSGPRHVAFHPTKKWVYCIHELDCTVDLYDWSEAGKKPAMKLRLNSVVSTLTKGTPLTGNTGCEIAVSDDGRFVYTCTRGVDEIVVFRVDPATGLLTEQQRVSSGGKVPRYFALDPSRKWLVCCNQGAGKTPVGNVTVFAHDPATGMLGEKPKTFAAETPMFTLFV